MSKGLTPGAVLPGFALPDENGTMHRLSELQGDNAMILMLGRGEHCPRERQQQRGMVRFHQWCPVAFTQLVTILPNDLHDVYKMRIAAGAHWPFLADREYKMQRAFEIEEYTDPHHRATVPYTLVVAPGLVIDKVYCGYWFWGRPSPWQLWEICRTCCAAPRPISIPPPRRRGLPGWLLRRRNRPGADRSCLMCRLSTCWWWWPWRWRRR
jgi:peroxiredoxin